MNKNEEKRIKILKHAQELFARYGLYKTSVDEIAKKARMGKSTIYYYFKSKEAIFEAVLQDEMEVLLKKVKTAIEQTKSPRKKFENYVIARIISVKELVNIYSAIKDDFMLHYAFIEEFRKDFDKEEIRMIKDILSDGIKKKEFEISDLDMTAFAIGTALKGLEYEWAIKTKEDDIEKNVNNLLGIIFYGIMTGKR